MRGYLIEMIRRLVGFYKLEAKLVTIEAALAGLNGKRSLSERIGDLELKIEDSRRDIIMGVEACKTPKSKLSVSTEFPIAYSSDDHNFPRGTKNDNTRSTRFVSKVEEILNKKPIDFLDLGCAGGG